MLISSGENKTRVMQVLFGEGGWFAWKHERRLDFWRKITLNPVGRGEGSSWERTGRLAAPRAEPALKWRFPPSPGRVPADSANPSLWGNDNIQLFFSPPEDASVVARFAPLARPARLPFGGGGIRRDAGERGRRRRNSGRRLARARS